MKGKGGLIIWTAAVWILSFCCYLPMALEQRGTETGLLWLKYIYVCVPVLCACFAEEVRGGLGKWLGRMFSGRAGGRQLALWGAVAGGGAAVSLIWSLSSGENLFVQAYPAAAAFPAGCAYLFVTGLAEEAAWRGFLLERTVQGDRKFPGLLISGVVWAVWHIPMWVIRNSLGAGEVLPLFIWTVLVGLVLGAAYFRCPNVAFTALLHMSFNVCWLAPVRCNVILLSLAVLIALRMGRRSGK